MMKYTVRIAAQTYEVEIEDLNKRPVIARIGQEVFEVHPENGLSGGVETVRREQDAKTATQAGGRLVKTPTAGETTCAKSILAPLPGTVVEIHIKTGDEVQPGQAMLTIEAMKMKNIIRATGAGKIKQVLVTIGQPTQHRQPLVEFE